MCCIASNSPLNTHLEFVDDFIDERSEQARWKGAGRQAERGQDFARL
jgi:hypothetical protein